jgi:hypothetical protein
MSESIVFVRERIIVLRESSRIRRGDHGFTGFCALF